MKFENSRAFARQLDQQDPLKKYRQRFFIPQVNGKESIYFCGNSLGLQPQSTQQYVEEELKSWRELGVEGHFQGKNPWFHYHKLFKKGLAEVVGAKEEEVVAMNNLTSNIHFLMVSFYSPNNQRFKIITEEGNFPSDQYALESQVKFHGFDPEKAIIELKPRTGEHKLRTEDILEAVQKHADELALVFMSGVQYYSGQFFNLKTITQAAHKVGAYAGFDLAHAVGNVPLALHDWEVDFAAWCTYKYLNSGPGSVGGAFVHQKHANRPELPRFAGWWGYDEEKRFQMEKGFIPMQGADGWQLSNCNVLPMAAHKAALEIFQEVGMKALRDKSLMLTAFLDFLIEELNKRTDLFEVLTPSNPKERGCQLSLSAREKGKELFDQLTESGVIADWREPNVIRVAPTPLYNSFEEVYDFVEILEKSYSLLIKTMEKPEEHEK
ncbi:kynureninase [Xanthovirga aplysinae]|uniref:kynureninase n=1 Tax=Xanthovirga aplysinae TaxID=2529853 RepID=UPI0012BD23CF|nr:kynureninase [Xanthovirga aplysinae]MTI31730.1 kynureninase [Xanthovirga aplysinae]